MMKPRPYQVQLGNDAAEILREHMMVYLAMEERTGKTITALVAAEQLNVKNVLVLTKKKALKGWQETLDNMELTKNYTVTNYHQASKLAGGYGLVILDESHNYIASYPKTSAIWKAVKKLSIRTPIIYISATPYAQGPQMLYHQFALNSWSPWAKHNNFYNWFKLYGKPYTIELNGVQVTQYDRCDTDLILGSTKHLFITKTRAELGFEHEPEDKLHYVDLEPATKALYNELVKDRLVEVNNTYVVCDTNPKLRTVLHQLEGGTIKVDSGNIFLPEKSKIKYALKHFGDSEKLVIMYNYKAEFIKLRQHFSKALLLQATSFAEGVDLHKYDNLVIYSQDFSTARHTQRRARQCNMQRTTPITVHYLLVKGAASERVYKTVSVNKKNFVDTVFERI